jgi:hypothetical protein
VLDRRALDGNGELRHRGRRLGTYLGFGSIQELIRDPEIERLGHFLTHSKLGGLQGKPPCRETDLPPKVLVWEDDAGRFWVSYNSPAYLQEWYGVPQNLMQNIAAVETLATKAAE